MRRIWGTVRGCTSRTIVTVLQKFSTVAEKVEVCRKFKKCTQLNDGFLFGEKRESYRHCSKSGKESSPNILEVRMLPQTSSKKRWIAVNWYEIFFFWESVTGNSFVQGDRPDLYVSLSIFHIEVSILNMMNCVIWKSQMLCALQKPGYVQTLSRQSVVFLDMNVLDWIAIDMVEVLHCSSQTV